MKILNQIKIEFMSVPDNVALARVAIASLAAQLDFTLNDIEEIKVATSEAVSNAIIHGYDGEPMGNVTIYGTIYDSALEIKVVDKGRGIGNLDEAMQPAFSTCPERMGLGFVFMQSFMSDFSVDTEVGQGTTVTMIKRLENRPVAMKLEG